MGTPIGKVENVALEFTNEQAPYIITKPLHPTQKHEWIGDKIRVEIKVMPNYELQSLILSYGEKVKVVGPIELKNTIA